MLGVASSTPAALNATSCDFGSPACSFTAADAGLLFDLPHHRSDSSQAFTVQAVRKSDNGLACTPAFANVNRSVNFRCSYDKPHHKQAAPYGRPLGAEHFELGLTVQVVLGMSALPDIGPQLSGGTAEDGIQVGTKLAHQQVGRGKAHPHKNQQLKRFSIHVLLLWSFARESQRGVGTRSRSICMSLPPRSRAGSLPCS